MSDSVQIDRRLGWIVAALAFVFYANTLSAGFTLDDVPIVKDNALVRSLANLPEIFRTHYWEANDWVADKGLYRPLTIASYALGEALHGAAPAGHHAANALLHALASWLWFRVVLGLGGARGVAFATALVFAAHPIHTEAVSGIVGRAEVLAFIGLAATLLAWERARTSSGPLWPLLTATAFFAGLLSKEIAIVAPAALLLIEALFPQRRWLLRRAPRALATLGALALAASAYFVLRANAIEARSVHPGWRGVESFERVATALRVSAEYVGLMVWPADLLGEYGVSEVRIASGLGEARVLGALALLAVLIALTVWSWRRLPVVAFGLCFFAGSLLPTSNLLFPIGVLKAERILYTPSAGFVLAAVALLAPLFARLRQPQWSARLALALVVAALGARTWVRNRDWENNYTLALASERIAPNSPVLQMNLAIWYREQGQLEQAKAPLAKVIEAEPQDWKAYSMLGEIETELGEFELAVAHLRLADQRAPGHIPVQIFLARALCQAQRFAEAVPVLEGLCRALPDNPASWANLVVALRNSGAGARANEVAREGQRRFPGHPAFAQQ
jgi:tetratricopeptide (TPR) repeat protein